MGNGHFPQVISGLKVWSIFVAAIFVARVKFKLAHQRGEAMSDLRAHRRHKPVCRKLEKIVINRC